LEWVLQLKNLTSAPAAQAAASLKQLSKELGIVSRNEQVAQQKALAYVQKLAKAEQQSKSLATAEAARALKATQVAQATERAASREIKALDKVANAQKKLASRGSSGGLSGGRRGGGSSGGVADVLGAIPGGGGLANIASMAASAGPAVAAVAAIAGIGVMASKAASVLAEGVYNATKFRQATVMSLQVLTKGDGNKAFDDLKQLAWDLGSPIQSLTGQMQSLLGAGFGVNQSTEMLKTFADLKTTGVSDDAIDRAMVAITQIKSTGKLQGDEMLQLAGNIPALGIDAIYEQLATQLGKSKADVMQMKEAGQIDATTAISAIMATARKVTGSQSAGDLAKSQAGGSLAGLQNRIELLKMNFFDNLAVAAGPAINGVITQLSGGLQGAMEWFSGPQGQALFGKMGDGISKVLGDISSALASPEGAAFMDGLVEGFETVWDIGMLVWDNVLKPFASGFLAGFSAEPLQKVGESLKAILSSQAVITYFTTLGAVLGGVVTVFSALWAVMMGVHRTIMAIASVPAGWISSLAGIPNASVPGGGSPPLPANASGGEVVGVSGGRAVVAAPGEGLASIGKGERIVPAGGSGGVNLNITINGSVTQDVMGELESRLSTLLERYAQ
jgi:tape measure domain-containing protein